MWIVISILLLLMLCLWPALIALSLTQHGSDPAGNGMARAFAAIIGALLWMLLALLLLLTGASGTMRWPGMAAALILVPLSGVAVQVSLQVMAQDRDLRWPAVLPVVMPLLLVVYAFWCFTPWLHSHISISVARGVAWGGLTILSPLPWIARWSQARTEAAILKLTPEELAREEAARAEEQRRYWREEFRRLTPDSEFWKWWNFTEDQEFREAAYAGLRNVKNRQEQVPKMLTPGQRKMFLALPDMDLTMTPELSAAVGAFLMDQVTNLRPYDPQKPMPTKVVTEWFEQYFPVLHWLREQDRDCDAELAAIEAAVCRYLDCDQRRAFLESLHGFSRSAEGARPSA